jgi:hypothetical protein
MKYNLKQITISVLLPFFCVFSSETSSAQTMAELLKMLDRAQKDKINLKTEDITTIKEYLRAIENQHKSSMSNLSAKNTAQSATLSACVAENAQLKAEINILKLEASETYKDLLATAKAYNLTSEAFQDSTATIKEWRSCTINEPRKIGTLNSGSDYFYHTITTKNSGTAQLLGIGNVSLSKNQSILIADYIHFKDTICTPGDGPPTTKSIRIAVGVRLSLTITAKEKKFEATLPKKVAAAMELNMVDVTYRISTLGFANDTTKNIIAEAGEGSFDVDAYVKVMATMSKLIKTMNSGIIANPVRVPHPDGP